MLWSALQSYFPDQATFIPTIVSVITTWCHAFVPWLEDVSNEAVTERILSGLKSAGDLKLVLEVLPPYLYLPKDPLFFLFSLLFSYCYLSLLLPLLGSSISTDPNLHTILSTLPCTAS